MPPPGRWTLLSLLLIAALGLSIYSNTLNGSFVFDDLSIILFNPAVKHLNDVELLWASFSTRILTGWTFALNYSWGKLSTLGYHIFNILLHIANATCVLFLLKEISQTPYFQGGRKIERLDLLCLFSALVFLAHPVQTQAVSYITQRASGLATFFYLLSLIFYMKARTHGRTMLYGLVAFFLICAMLSKEMTVTIPLMFMVCEVYFYGLNRGNLLSRLKSTAPWLLFMAVIPLLLLFDRPFSVLRLKGQLMAVDLNPANFLTEINVLRTYLRLLVFPVAQNLDYDYPLATSLLDWPVLGSLALLLLVAAAAWVLFEKSRLASFSIVWFFLTISVETVVCALIGNDMIFEHYLYLPMVGFAYFSAGVISRLSASRSGFLTIMCLLIVLLSLLTYQRNRVWDNPVTLWEDVLKKSPQKVRPHVNLGFAYRMINDYPKALEYYFRALSLKAIKDKSRAQILVNIAAIYGRAGKYEQEITYCLQALEYEPHHVQALSNLGYAYYLLNDYDKALYYGRQAVNLNPTYVQGLINLGTTLWAAGEPLQSVGLYQEALRLDPDNKTAQNNLRRAYSLLKAGNK